ncbi:MAG: hypothetical protein KC423_07050 [Anaerolineales bacterium]|nr:hypothetical protein [Anaerolineales bacterium]
MTEDLTQQIAAGLAGRLRSLVLVIDRLDRLESGGGDWLARFAEDELAETTLVLTLRALATVANRDNFRVLAALVGSDSLGMGELMAVTGNGRLLLSERLNDLVQVGLAARLIDTDHAQITAAGVNMVQLIEEISRKTAEEFERRRLRD